MKEFRLVVAGGRDFNCFRTLSKWLKRIHKKHPNLIIVSGTARGADKLGENWAVLHSVSIERFPADWKKHGKQAGYLRNVEMAKVADGVILFWDGKSKGTHHMKVIAEHDYQLPTKIVKYTTF